MSGRADRGDDSGDDEDGIGSAGDGAQCVDQLGADKQWIAAVERQVEVGMGPVGPSVKMDRGDLGNWVVGAGVGAREFALDRKSVV